jgi:hypothetical protein
VIRDEWSAINVLALHSSLIKAGSHSFPDPKYTITAWRSVPYDFITIFPALDLVS